MITTKKPTETGLVRLKKSTIVAAKKFAKKQGISTGMLFETALYKFITGFNSK